MRKTNEWPLCNYKEDLDERLKRIERELDDVTKEFEQLLRQDLPTLNESLKSKGQQPLSPPAATKVGATDATHGSGGVADPSASLPADFHISW